MGYSCKGIHKGQQRKKSIIPFNIQRLLEGVHFCSKSYIVVLLLYVYEIPFGKLQLLVIQITLEGNKRVQNSFPLER